MLPLDAVPRGDLKHARTPRCRGVDVLPTPRGEDGVPAETSAVLSVRLSTSCPSEDWSAIKRPEESDWLSLAGGA